MGAASCDSSRPLRPRLSEDFNKKAEVFLLCFLSISTKKAEEPGPALEVLALKILPMAIWLDRGITGDWMGGEWGSFASFKFKDKKLLCKIVEYYLLNLTIIPR